MAADGVKKRAIPPWAETRFYPERFRWVLLEFETPEEAQEWDEAGQPITLPIPERGVVG